MDQPMMTNEQINLLIKESSMLLDEVQQIRDNTNTEDNTELQQQRYAEWLELQNDNNDQNQTDDIGQIIKAETKQNTLDIQQNQEKDNENSQSSQTEPEKISTELQAKITKISEKLERQADANLIQDDEYRILLTEIKNFAPLTNNENQQLQFILSDSYLESINYPQMQNPEDLITKFKQAKLNPEKQSLFSELTFNTQKSFSVSQPPLSERSASIWQSLNNKQEIIEIDIPEINGQPDYIRLQRRDRILENHMKNIDFCLEQIKSDQTVIPLSKDEITSFLIDFYANPENLENLPQNDEIRLTEQEKSKLDIIMAGIREQAVKLAEENGEHQKPVLEEFLDDFNAQELQNTQNLSDFNQQQEIEEEMRKTGNFAQFEKKILAKVDLIEKKRVLAPGRKNEPSPRRVLSGCSKVERELKLPVRLKNDLQE